MIRTKMAIDDGLTTAKQLILEDLDKLLESCTIAQVASRDPENCYLKVYAEFYLMCLNLINGKPL